ncbi:hypothetical protein HYH03_018421 [Edaphochlamys debaryana]|uniref:Uncharacterized protein n=1 Tax=Edaphochlamys debaryana TaxID=47281 RepID=A0A835XH22_9CHLO|nr:hypothetical protein HYH03_018421 [Edaphochlamys debaryana]|eukprot:KAG2482648.1 hypothetical protein HYH03_018421 [Edaphochlamys debaryana]
MEELRYSLFLGGAKPTIVNRWAAQKTLSDSSADVHEEECFKEAQYLDASSDEYQDASHDDAPSMLQSLRATVVAADFSSQPASFQRRPRKQLKPVACSC